MDIPPEEQLSLEEKIKIVTGFLLDSPPGEVDDVFNDLRILMNDDAAFQAGILSALEEYNTEQFITAALPGHDHQVIVSRYGQLEPDFFIDPRSHLTFKFDHLRQRVIEVKPHELDEESEPIRGAIDSAIQEFVSDHYPTGVVTVYAKDQKVTIAIVNNKYNPENLWNGRWRSVWHISPESGEIKGSIKVNVHYFEDGNVQLNCNKDFEAIITTSLDDHNLAAAAYVKQISKSEHEFQTSLIEAYSELADNTFKSLRRALPMTRHKLDWDKIMNYKIKEELLKK
ncbi:hypothetical protein G9A89_007037 [Geosiphon pyriformis]|nr:hypothetical protein G9A89_007037 [Geosiphon pyriformis]